MSPQRESAIGDVVNIDQARRPVVVVGIDGSELSESALRRSLPVVELVGAELVIVFVRELPSLAVSRFSADALAALSNTLDELEASCEAEVEKILATSSIRWRFLVRDGEPAHEILEVAHEEGASCIIIGATIHGAVSSLVLSSVAAHLLHHSDVTVVIVRPDRPAHPPA